MSSGEKDIFSLAGPFHLTPSRIDWNNLDQRRAVVASLVRGAGTMERDRQNGRVGPYALAPTWWESFNFKLHETLTDKGDCTIYGAIFRYRSPVSPGDHPTHNYSPNYVVVFRGMNVGRESIGRDIKYDTMCMVHSLQRSSRSKDALRRVQDLVETVGPASVWLAGHSLGSALAMLIGKAMAQSGSCLEAYLFNPPFISLPVELIRNTTLRNVVHTTTSVVKAGLAHVLKAVADRPLEDSHFAALSAWVPYIFVNWNDPLCSGYIGYFENRRNMEAIGAGQMGRIATQHTLGSLISGAIGMDLKPVDILPSAHLTVNSNRDLDPKEAHGIKQWWASNVQCEESIHLL